MERKLLEIEDGEVFNPENCEYKTHIAGIGGKKPCNFKMKKLPKPIQTALEWCTKLKSIYVVIPTGTKMYRGTLVYSKMKKLVPWIPNKRFGWFTSTIEHQGNINYTQIDEYEVMEPLLCIFIPNLHSKGLRGNEYYRNIIRASMTSETRCEIVEKASSMLQERDRNLNIDGYVGCDECEIGLTQPSIMRKIKHRGIVKTKSLAFID